MTSWSISRVHTRTRVTDLRGDTLPETEDRQGFLCLTLQTETAVGRTRRVVGVDGAETLTRDMLDEAIRDAGRQRSRLSSLRGEQGGSTEAPTFQAIDITQMAFPSWLQPLRREEESLDLVVATAAGDRFQETMNSAWIAWGQVGECAGRVPENSPEYVAPEPAWDTDLLLFSPWALSQLCTTYLLTGITSGRASRWPRGIVYDPAWGNGHDLEGTIRRPRVFSSSGRLVSTATDMQRRQLSGGVSTGHAGIARPHIRDLVISDDGNIIPFPDSGVVITEATLLTEPSDDRGVLLGIRIASRADPTDHTAVVPATNVCDLLDLGAWCGPYLRGVGPWVSRWLAIWARDLDIAREPFE